MGFIEVLTIVFIILKLCGIISWSWLIVFLPMLIVIALDLLILGICMVKDLKKHRATKRNIK